MPEPILASVALQAELIEGAHHQAALHDIIQRFATAALYKNTPATLDKLRRQILTHVARREFPYAQAVGRASAEPILKELGGTRLVDQGNRLRGTVLNRFRREHKANLLTFRAELRMEVRTLSGEVESAFARAYRDGIARKRLVADLVASDKAELLQLGKARVRVNGAVEKLDDAQTRLATASKRGSARARRAVREAKKEVTKARASVRATKSFYARFETRIQGRVRDSLRHEARQAEEASFRSAGYGDDAEFMWVSVSGSEACPSCANRHGSIRKRSEWKGDSPGDGSTYCGESCKCALVPTEYSVGRKSLEKPLVA